MKIDNIIYTSQSIKKNENSKKPNFKRAWEEHISWGANYIAKSGKTDFKLFSFPDAKEVFVEVAKRTKANILTASSATIALFGAAAETLFGSNKKDESINSKLYKMKNEGNGIFTAKDIETGVDDNYRFVVVTKDNKIQYGKDPYAKKQENIHGWSNIYDSDSYIWQNTDWIEGKDTRRIKRNPNEPMKGLENLWIDEVNVPTISLDGTFDAAKKRIDTIAERGIATAVELMPVENTYSMQWGYDGVDKFAVNEKLGGPDKLKELIDYIHGKGLNVIIDMVPNHMGPDGNYLNQVGHYMLTQEEIDFKKFLHPNKSFEFGGNINYEFPDNKYVRDWMANAALWWANEFKVDGIRLDLTKEVDSDWFLKQLATELSAHNPDVFIIAEDHRDRMPKLTEAYDLNQASHEEELKNIDNAIERIGNGHGIDVNNMRITSEWDSNYQKTIKDAVFGRPALDRIDYDIKSSHYRVKYFLSHDEIGNNGGTRLIPKYIYESLDIPSAIDRSYSQSDREKMADTVSQQLAELIASKDFEKMSQDELVDKEREFKLSTFIDKQTLENTFRTALAKQRNALGLVMTTPGPKMYFQGDDEADLSRFKFFREFAGEKEARNGDYNSRAMYEGIDYNKGYCTLEEVARPDAIVGRVDYQGEFKNTPKQMIKFSSELAELVKNNPALLKGAIADDTYKDYRFNVHTHRLVLEDQEFLIIKNFGYNFHNKSYGYSNFPEGTWKEVFNSDSKEYGGSGYTNSLRKSITRNNQNLSLAPNSFIILERTH